MICDDVSCSFFDEFFLKNRIFDFVQNENYDR